MFCWYVFVFFKKNQLFNCLTLQLKTVYSNQTLVGKKINATVTFPEFRLGGSVEKTHIWVVWYNVIHKHW